jgi:alpha-1,2-mannosyltransferase
MKIRLLSGRLFSRLAEDHLFRRRAGTFLAFLLLLTAGLVLVNPPKRGLVGSYYLNTRWAGSPNLTTRERKIGLGRLKHEYPAMRANYSISWTGAIFIPATGEYRFSTVSGDGSEILIDGRIIVDGDGPRTAEERAGVIDLTRGFHTIRVRYAERSGEGVFYAFWAPPGKARRGLSSALLFTGVPKHGGSPWILPARQALLSALVVFWCVLLTLFILSPGASFSGPGRPEPATRVSPAVLKLAAFFLINGLALNVMLSLFSERTVLDFSRFFLNSPVHAGEDSWRQIANALDYLEAPHDRPLYAEVFFARKNKFQYPPTSLVLFEPLRRLPYSKFVSAANILSWLMVIASTGFLALIFSRALSLYGGGAGRSFPERGLRIALAAGFTLTFYPLVKSYELGQIQTWLYFFFVIAVWAWTGGRKMLAGIFVGAICVIKPQLGLLVVWGGLRKEWRFVAGATATAGSLGLISLGLFGWENHVDYLRALSFMAKHGESYYTNQSVNGLLNRLFFNGTNLHGNPHAFAPYNRWIYLATLASSVVLIGAALIRKRGAFRRAGNADFLAAALTFTIASPIAWEHHYNILLPIFAVALPAVLARWGGRAPAWMLALAFALTANIYVLVNALANTRLNFLQSHLFFGAMILLFLLHLLRRRPAEAEEAEVEG